LDLKGKPYENKSGGPYQGSVCDSCEKKGIAHWHHPLRCGDIHPGWDLRGQAPELNGVVSWYIRPE
jgi:hypothetical protein